MLKEVAGTKVYEERRAESTKIMEETSTFASSSLPLFPSFLPRDSRTSSLPLADTKRDKITDLLQFINDRLSELEEEKEELKQFQVQDRQRRSLEYSIYQRELKEVGEALDNVRPLHSGQ